MKFDSVDKSLVKLAKWIVIFLLVRVRNPVKLAGFLSLNPLFKRVITESLRSIARDKTLINEKRCIDKTSNALSCWLLYSATIGNDNVPVDYIGLYLWGFYLNSVSRQIRRLKYSISNAVAGKSEIIDDIMTKVYQRKEILLYSVLFGKMLSQYLTPLSMSPDRKYLSAPVKKRIFDPIWKCYSLSTTRFAINWIDFLKAYIKHNVIVTGALFAFTNYRTFVSKNILSEESKAKFKESLLGVFKKVNSFFNAVYLQNLLSFLLLSGSALTFSHLKSYNKLQRLSTKRITLYKNIIGFFGFASAYFSLYLNEVISNRKPIKESSGLISKTFLNGLNIYLFRLLILSKWRKAKDNSSFFRHTNKQTLNTAETIFMCIGLFKLMNYNSYLKENNKTNLQTGLISIIDKLM